MARRSASLRIALFGLALGWPAVAQEPTPVEKAGARVKPVAPLAQPARGKETRLLCSGPAAALVATTPFQQTEKREAGIEVRIFQPPAAPGSAASVDRKALTSPEPGIESDAPEIGTFAAEAVKGVAWSEDRVKALGRAVQMRVADSGAVRSATEALRLRSGGAEGRARLFVAAARVTGTPAALVFGLRLGEDGTFAPHHWAEVVVEPARWTVFDPSSADAADLALRLALTAAPAGAAFSAADLVIGPAAASALPFTPESRPAVSPELVEASLGTRTYGLYLSGAKQGSTTFTYARETRPEGPVLVVTEDHDAIDQAAGSLWMTHEVRTYVFDGSPPWLLRSAARERPKSEGPRRGAAVGEFLRFRQDPQGATVTKSDGFREEEPAPVPFVDLTFDDVVADRLLLMGSAEPGAVASPRALDFKDLERRAVRRGGGSQDPIRPRAATYKVVGVDPGSTTARFRVEAKAGALVERRTNAADGWLTRSVYAASSGLRDEMVLEQPDIARSPFDADGRYRAPLKFLEPADGPELVEALTIRVEPDLASLVDRDRVASFVPGTERVEVALAGGERSATAADRQAITVAGPHPPEDVARWAKETASDAAGVRDRLAKLRTSVAAEKDLDYRGRADRLAAGARSLGIPCAVVEGLAIVDDQGEALAPHAWVEALDGDVVIAVDPVVARVPGPPTRLPLRTAEAAARKAFDGDLAVTAMVVSKKVRDVGVPDLRQLSGWMWTMMRPKGKQMTARDLRTAAKTLGLQQKRAASRAAELGDETGLGAQSRPRDEMEMPDALPRDRAMRYMLVPIYADALRKAAIRDRWDDEDVEMVRVVAELLGAMPDPPEVGPVENPAAARAAARTLGAWLEAQLRQPAVYAAFVGEIDHGPFVGIPVSLDLAFDRTLGKIRAAGLDLVLGRAVVRGRSHSILRAERDGKALWARAICFSGGEPMEKEFGPAPVTALGSAGFRIYLGGGRVTKVYLDREGMFQFYFQTW